MQKIGIIVIVLFVGLSDERVRGHIWWMALLIVLPPLYVALESWRRRRMKRDLDIDSERYLGSLDRIPMFPWLKPA